MKKGLIVGLLFWSLTAVAQPINSEKVFGGYRFTQEGTPLTMKQMVTIMEPNADAGPLMAKARNQYVWTSVLGGAGGFFIGYPLGTALGGGDPNWTLAAVGAGIIAVAIPIGSAANRNAKQAVDLYNQSQELDPVLPKPKMEIISTGTRAGIRLNW